MDRNKWYIAQTPSTNTAIKEWIKGGAPFRHGCLYTDHQTSGKGQRGNSWDSEPGQNILCSFLVDRPEPGMLHHLNRAAMWAVHRTLESQGVLDSKIKWPNDLLVSGRKVAGILMENTFEGNRIKYAVAGIGLNVNQTRFTHAQAASMRMLSGKEFVREQLLDQLYDQFYTAVDRAPEALLEACNGILWGREEMMTFEGEHGREQFRIEALHTDGELIVEGMNGQRFLHHPQYKMVL